MVKLSVLCGKWATEILMALSETSMRFSELTKKLSTSEKRISSRILADRLRELEDENLIIREISDSRPPKTIYKLSNKGKEAIKLTNKLYQL
jgi:DNA-binding HxlR family transcriptional regulator